MGLGTGICHFLAQEYYSAFLKIQIIAAFAFGLGLR